MKWLMVWLVCIYLACPISARGTKPGPSLSSLRTMSEEFGAA